MTRFTKWKFSTAVLNNERGWLHVVVDMVVGVFHEKHSAGLKLRCSHLNYYYYYDHHL